MESTQSETLGTSPLTHLPLCTGFTKQTGVILQGTKKDHSNLIRRYLTRNLRADKPWADPDGSLDCWDARTIQTKKEVRMKYRLQENTKTKSHWGYWCVCCVLCRQGPPRRADHSSRGVLRSVCVCVWLSAATILYTCNRVDRRS
jgi:hypothetical protein